MIAVIRIKGQVGLRKEIKETLDRLRIRRKYACVVLKDSKENLGMIQKVKDFVAFGEINKETLEALIEKRAKTTEKKKIDAKKIVDEILKGTPMEKLALKPFFRLHPPRGGVKTKLPFSVGGVLGNHKEKINELIMRML